MSITAIRGNLFSVNKSKNIQQKNQNTPNFKGFSYEMYGEKESERPRNLQKTGYTRKHEDLLPPMDIILKKEVRLPDLIYIASPHEDIPPEVYKTHTHIQKNDLPLSQIKNDSGYMFRNFAENARCEAKHWAEIVKAKEKIIKDKTLVLEKLTQRDAESILSKFSEKIRINIAKEKNVKIETTKQELAKAQEDKQRAQERIELSDKREKVLEKMDELHKKLEQYRKISAQASYGVEDAEKNLKSVKEDIFKKEEKQKKQLQMLEKSLEYSVEGEGSKTRKSLEKEIQELKLKIVDKENDNVLIQKAQDRIRNAKEVWEQKKQDEDNIRDNIKEEFNNVAKFYREYYPEWSDI